jgi:hypothetical protein
VDANGKPKEVRSFVPKTEEEKLVFEEAEQRRLLRKKLQDETRYVASPTAAVKGDLELKFNDPDLNFNVKLLNLYTYVSQRNLAFKKAKDSVAEVTHLVLVSHANTIGVTFGGQIMAWMVLPFIFVI